MSAVRLLCVLACLLGALASAEKDPWGKDIPVHPWMGQTWPMRSRVCANYTAGIACRIPYHLLPRDQDVAAYSRIRAKTVWIDTGKTASGQNSVKESTMEEWEGEPAVRLVSEAAAQAPSDLKAVGDRLAGPGLEWKPYDYYLADVRRPFAAATYAPPGITALIGVGKGRRALVLYYQAYCTAVVLSGDIANIDGLLDQVQVMTTDAKGVRMTWAEAQGTKGVCLTAEGLPGKSPTAPVAWKQGLGIETRHYQVTGNIPSAKLAARARDLEALYAAYAKFFETQNDAPLKFEVHISDTWATFQELCAACDNKLDVAPGEMIGGFFVPSQQSLWIYEESGKLGGPSMSIEHVMCHECSHQFLHMACNGSSHVPTWVNEGIAVYFENGVLANGRYQYRDPVDRIKELAGIYRKTRTTVAPLNHYLDHHGPISAVLYGEVYAMVHYWAFGSPSGKTRFRAYWKALRAGEDGAKAFERIFLVDMAKKTGSRQLAIDNWRELLTQYVLTDLSRR
mgnify:CR=1 FL=1